MRHRFDPWVGNIPWRMAQQPTPVFLSGESYGQRSLAGCSSQGCTESNTTEVTQHTCTCVYIHIHVYIYTHTHIYNIFISYYCLSTYSLHFRPELGKHVSVSTHSPGSKDGFKSQKLWPESIIVSPDTGTDSSYPSLGPFNSFLRTSLQQDRTNLRQHQTLVVINTKG